MSESNITSAEAVPRVGVGAVVIKENRILLVKRKNPPHQGEWAIPGGKVKWGETLKQAAEREILEETGIHIKAHEAVNTFELIEHNDQQQVTWHYVIVDLMSTYVSGEPHASSDALEVRWFDKKDFTSEPVNSTTLHLLKQVIHFLGV